MIPEKRRFGPELRLGPNYYRRILYSTSISLDDRIRAAHRCATEEFLDVCKGKSETVTAFCAAWIKLRAEYFGSGRETFLPGCWWPCKRSNQADIRKRKECMTGPMGHRLRQEYAEWMSRFVDIWVNAWEIANKRKDAKTTKKKTKQTRTTCGQTNRRTYECTNGPNSIQAPGFSLRRCRDWLDI